jgi:hypothetical protein
MPFLGHVYFLIVRSVASVKYRTYHRKEGKEVEKRKSLRRSILQIITEESNDHTHRDGDSQFLIKARG